tara:strand:- start:449 stop:871 length:423 start_codon:yes stop_codon:yes gene_type:complete
MATESLPFIFGEVAKAKTKDQKKATLIKYDNSALRELLRYAFDPNLKFLLPPGNPPHKYAGDTDEPNPTYLYGLVRKLYLFVEGGNTALKQSRREYLFIEMLESIHPLEAELLLQVKDKKVKCRGLTYNLVKNTFPDLLP